MMNDAKRVLERLGKPWLALLDHMSMTPECEAAVAAVEADILGRGFSDKQWWAIEAIANYATKIAQLGKSECEGIEYCDVCQAAVVLREMLATRTGGSAIGERLKAMIEQVETYGADTGGDVATGPVLDALKSLLAPTPGDKP